jgi:hypothetical protein
MQGPDHLYCLVDELNRSLYVENGIVKRSALPRPLNYTPDGWRNIEINNARNQKYFALDRAFTVPLEFVEDGAQILKDAYYKNGIEAKVWLVIVKQKMFYDGTEYGWYYDAFYKGEIDFSNFNHVGPKVTVNIMEGGIAKLIKAKENVKYELDIDVPEAMKIKMDGIKVGYEFQFTTFATTYDVSTSLAPFRQFLMNFSRTDLTDRLVNVVTNDVIKTVDLSIDYANDDTWFLHALSSVNFSARFRFTARLRTQFTTGTGQFRIRLYNQAGTIVHTFLDVTSSTFFFDQTVTIDETITLNLAEGDRLFLVARVDGTSFTGDMRTSMEVSETGTDFSYGSIFRGSFPKALSPLYVFQKLIEKITDGAYQAQSDLLAQYFNFTITCGDAIRGISGAKLKTSLADFFSSFNTQFDIGLGEIAGKVRLEKKEFFIDYTNPIDLGEVSKLKVKPATDYYFNTLKIGYPEQDYDNPSGKQEFNNTSQYTSPITRITKELNLVSAYRADSYGIEFTRINFEGKNTTDSDSDNDVFLIHTKETPITDPAEGTVYELNRDLNPFVTGLQEPETVFNVFLSPRRCLDRNGRSIHSYFYKLDTGKLVFQTTDKNANLATTTPSVIEKSDVNTGGLAAQLFNPNMLEFDTPAPVDLVEALEASPIRAFTGTYLGFAFTGIPVKVGIRASDYEAQTYQLLASPDTNLEPLIEIFE